MAKRRQTTQGRSAGLPCPSIIRAAGAESRGHGSEQVRGTRQRRAPAAQTSPERVRPAKPLAAFSFDLGHVS